MYYSFKCKVSSHTRGELWRRLVHWERQYTHIFICQCFSIEPHKVFKYIHIHIQQFDWILYPKTTFLLPVYVNSTCCNPICNKLFFLTRVKLAELDYKCRLILFMVLLIYIFKQNLNFPVLFLFFFFTSSKTHFVFNFLGFQTTYRWP